MTDMFLPFARYFDFQGRSTRKEYWLFFLFWIMGYLVTRSIDVANNPELRTGPAGPLFVLLTIIPLYSVSIRRLHDIDRTGWWILISFIPLIGNIVLIVFHCKSGTEGINRFGSSQKKD